MFKVLKFEMRVDLSGVQITMAQELLDVTNTGAAAQEMSGAAMAKGVHRGLEFSLQSTVADAVGDHLIRETTAGYREPQGRRRGDPRRDR